MQQDILDPHVQLEMVYVAEYLKSKGVALADLQHLPDARVSELMKEASQYASVKLTNLELRAGMVHELDTNPRLLG